MASSLELPAVPTALEEIRRVVTVFRELRSGLTADGRTRVKSPSATLSTAEAISVVTDRKSTRLNSSHANISYAVFCLKKKQNTMISHCRTHLSPFIQPTHL